MTRTRRTSVALLAALGAGTAASGLAQEVVRDSSFRNRFGTFRIRLTSSKITTGVYGYPSTQVLYRVDRDGRFLHPSSLDGGRLIGCDRIPPEGVVLEPLGEGPQTVGWLIGVGGICGNTFSWTVALVVPSGGYGRWEYHVDSYLAKEIPIVRRQRGRTEVWSKYQEWGGTGTALSFFVPEMRVIRVDERGEARIHLGKLDPDFRRWPDTKWINFLGLFVGGASNLNPELMERAMALYDEASARVLREHGLPTLREDLEALIYEVRRTRRLRAHFRWMDLQWEQNFPIERWDEMLEEPRGQQWDEGDR